MTIRAQREVVYPRHRVLELVRPAVSSSVEVSAVEDPMLQRVDVHLGMPRWWWPRRRRRELVAACAAVADAPAGVIVRVHVR